MNRLMKAFAVMSALSSSAALASERCEIKSIFKSRTQYQDYSQAERFCSQFSYSRIPCKITQRNDYSYDSVIDFNEIFRGQGDTFRTARTQAYQNFFNFLEQRRIYSLPIQFTVVFTCQNSQGGYSDDY